MTSVVKLERLVEPCTEIFISKMLEKLHTPIDLGEWVHWYSFDVIGEITFLKRFGFMEEERDVNDIISSQSLPITVVAWLSQIPEIFKVLLGNPLTIWISNSSATMKKHNPALYIIEVRVLQK